MQRFSWILFVVIGALGLLMTVAWMASPGAGLETLTAAAGMQGASFDPEQTALVHFVIRWTATALLGANGLTILVATGPFRRGERWAGFALAYWPVLFVSHLAMYEAGPKSLVQVVLLVLTIGALTEFFVRTRGLTMNARSVHLT